MNINLEQVRPEIVKHIVNSLSTMDFVTEVLYNAGIQDSRYQNGKGMFAWNKTYGEIEKMESLFDDVMVFHANMNSWKFPLVYDERTQILFLLMSENNLNQKRKQKVSENSTVHYSKLLCKINQALSRQTSLFESHYDTPAKILSAFTSDFRIELLPSNLKLVIVCSQQIHGELVKVTAAPYDTTLLLTEDEVDWSHYIDVNYDYDNVASNIKELIESTNANTKVMNTLKESLISLKPSAKEGLIS